jgi:hypothetical protein
MEGFHFLPGIVTAFVRSALIGLAIGGFFSHRR